MAFPTWNADVVTGGTTVNATSTTITLPSSRAVGDRVVVWFTVDGGTAGTWPSGWTSVYSISVGGGAARAECRYRDWTGTETAAQGSGGTISVTHPNQMASWVSAYVDAGTFHTGTAPEPAAGTGTSTTPNAPALNPAGWDVEDTSWTVAAQWGNGAVPTVSARPSGYTIIGETIQASGESTGTLVAFKNSAAASEDPGTYTLSVSQAWGAITTAFRPAAAVAGGWAHLMSDRRNRLVLVAA